MQITVRVRRARAGVGAPLVRARASGRPAGASACRSMHAPHRIACMTPAAAAGPFVAWSWTLRPVRRGRTGGHAVAHMYGDRTLGLVYFAKVFKILRHIEFLVACMEH